MLPRRINGESAYVPAGAMRQQITILQKNPTPDSFGGRAAPIAYATKVWASIQSLRQSELDKIQTIETESWYWVTIRYIPGLTEEMTLLSPDGRTWFISAINDTDYLHVQLRILVREINAGVVSA